MALATASSSVAAPRLRPHGNAHGNARASARPVQRSWQQPQPLARRHEGRQVARSSSGEAELAEVDPVTGLEIAAASASAPSTSLSVEAGGHRWAYRHAPASPEAASPEKLPVLCLHGLGSSSYSYRTVLRLLAGAGHDCYAVDWLGHGGSDKPTPGAAFDYSSAAFVGALRQAVAALSLRTPFALVVQGYVLGQYGLQYALEQEDSIAKLIILNTPLSPKSKLRPELAAYKSPLPFMRPAVGKQFDAMRYNAAGGPYAMQLRDAQAYATPYEEEPAASAAVAAVMEQLDFPALLSEVDEGFRTWRRPTLVLHGTSDSFLDLKLTLDWLESKRTCVKLATGLEAKLGHMPQEDYPEAICPALLDFLSASSD